MGSCHRLGSPEFSVLEREGTVYGFTVVDVGGNWLRISRLGDIEESAAATDETTGLARVIGNAARLGDARGDDLAAIRLLSAGLEKYPDAPAFERVSALLYRAELACRIPDVELARVSLAEARRVELFENEDALVADDIAHAVELVAEL